MQLESLRLPWLVAMVVSLSLVVCPASAIAQSHLDEGPEDLTAPIPPPPSTPSPQPPETTWTKRRVYVDREMGESALLDAGEGRLGGAIFIEFLGGAAGYLVGFSPFIIDVLSDADGVGAISLVTVPFGISLGIWGAGTASGGDGSFWMTFLGQALGGAASIPFVLAGIFCGGELEDPDDPDNCGVREAVAVGAVLTLPVVGGVLAYEWSNDVPYASDQSPPPAERASVQFGAGPTPDGRGASVAMRGRF